MNLIRQPWRSDMVRSQRASATGSAPLTPLSFSIPALHARHWVQVFEGQEACCLQSDMHTLLPSYPLALLPYCPLTLLDVPCLHHSKRRYRCYQTLTEESVLSFLQCRRCSVSVGKSWLVLSDVGGELIVRRNSMS